MDTTAERSLGASLTKTSGTPKVISGLTKIGEFGVESEELDATTLDSEGGFKEFLLGFKDSGSIPLEGLVKDESVVEEMYGLADDQSLEDWEIDTNKDSSATFSAYVMNFKFGEMTVDNLRSWTADLRVSGAIDYNGTASI